MKKLSLAPLLCSVFGLCVPREVLTHICENNLEKSQLNFRIKAGWLKQQNVRLRAIGQGC